MTADSAPQHIGKYAIKDTLGKGAMGVVYRGYDEQIDRVVAIKTIRKAAFADDELVDAMGRFQREAQAAGRLVHPNIVTVYEYGEEADSAFIAMEFAEGRSLKELVLAKKAFSVRAIRTICSQLLAGLQYAHGHGVVHRDIKLENILLTREGRVKIMDFGIARVESSSLTSAGTFMGTPAYMAPELFEDQEADACSDLFSVGVVIYLLITGEKPFSGSTMTAIMQQVMNVEPARPSELVAGLPVAVDRLLQKALAKDRNKRFSSGKEFSVAMQDALGGLDDQLVLGPGSGGGANDATVYQGGSAAIPAQLGRLPQLLSSLSRPQWLMAGGAVLLLVLLTGWLIFGGASDSGQKEESRAAIQPQTVKKKVAGQDAPSQTAIKVISPSSSKKRSAAPRKRTTGTTSISSKAPQKTKTAPQGGGIRFTVRGDGD